MSEKFPQNHLVNKTASVEAVLFNEVEVETDTSEKDDFERLHLEIENTWNNVTAEAYGSLPPPLSQELEQSNKIELEREYDEEKFSKEIADFFTEDALNKLPIDTTEIQPLLTLFTEGKSITEILIDEQTKPYALEALRILALYKSEDSHSQVTHFLSKEFKSFLRDFSNTNTKISESEDGLSPYDQRRIFNNTSYLVSEALKNSNEADKNDLEQWLACTIDTYNVYNPDYVSLQGSQDTINEYVYKNILLKADNKDLIKKTVEHMSFQEVMGVLREQLSSSVPMDSKKEIVGQLTDRIGLDRKAIEHWEKSKVFYKKDTAGNDVFRESYEENLEAAQALESTLPGSADKLFKEYGIANFNRYDQKMLLRQIENESVDKPYGVVALPESDWNGAFGYLQKSLSNMGQQLNAGGYEVRFIEVGTQYEMAKRLARLNNKYNKPENGNRIGFLVLGGHGTRETIALSDQEAHPIPPPLPGDYEDYQKQFDEWEIANKGIGARRPQILMADLEEGGGKGIRRAAEDWFEEESTVVLVSCSTGTEGGIAQKISKELAFETVAPKQPTNVESITVNFNEKGKPEFEVNYFNVGEEVQAVRYVAGNPSSN